MLLEGLSSVYELRFAAKYPYTCNPADVLECQKQMRIVNGFCSDVQVRGYYPTYIERYFDEKGIKIAKEPGDDEILRNGTIDFYNFSYYMSPLRPARWPRDTVLSMSKNMTTARAISAA